MKRLIIVCEGPTEQEFCRDVLAPYFLSRNIILEFPTIKQTNGGIVAWATLKKQLIMHLRGEDVIVSTLIDFYGIRKSYCFPGWEELERQGDKYSQLDYLEKQMKEDMPEDIKLHFIPYVQLHEFEALLFSDIAVFRRNFMDSEIKMDKIEKAIQSVSSPEDINNGPSTAPSKRLSEAISGYDKIVYGACLAEEIGLSVIREKCRRFNHWIELLEKI